MACRCKARGACRHRCPADSLGLCIDSGLLGVGAMQLKQSTASIFSGPAVGEKCRGKRAGAVHREHCGRRAKQKMASGRRRRSRLGVAFHIAVIHSNLTDPVLDPPKRNILNPNFEGVSVKRMMAWGLSFCGACTLAGTLSSGTTARAATTIADPTATPGTACRSGKRYADSGLQLVSFAG